jgi:tetratricopeptide (TPR) repeat protein
MKMTRGVATALLWSGWFALVPVVGVARPATRPAPATSAPVPLDAAVAAAARAKIDAFVDRVSRDPAIKDAAKEVIADAWQRRRAEADPRGFLEEAQAVLSPQYKQALDAMAEQKYADAEKLLVPLTTSADPYIAAHAASSLARSLIEQDRIDDAIKLLDAWRDRDQDVARCSFQGPEMDFMRAYGLLRTLKYERAMAALARFMQDHPDAPDRLRLTARQILQELQQRKPEQLGDVADLMGYAGRQLRVGLSDQPVVEAQNKAVELLNRLIKESEEQEQQGQGGGGGGKSSSKGQPGAARGRPGAPAERSTLPEGPTENGPLRRSPVARPGEMWGRMPAQQREKILQSLRKNFPERYRELVEQYYKQLGKQD